MKNRYFPFILILMCMAISEYAFADLKRVKKIVTELNDLKIQAIENLKSKYKASNQTWEDGRSDKYWWETISGIKLRPEFESWLAMKLKKMNRDENDLSAYSRLKLEQEYIASEPSIEHPVMDKFKNYTPESSEEIDVLINLLKADSKKYSNGFSDIDESFFVRCVYLALLNINSKSCREKIVDLFENNNTGIKCLAARVCRDLIILDCTPKMKKLARDLVKINSIYTNHLIELSGIKDKNKIRKKLSDYSDREFYMIRQKAGMQIYIDVVLLSDCLKSFSMIKDKAVNDFFIELLTDEKYMRQIQSQGLIRNGIEITAASRGKIIVDDLLAVLENQEYKYKSSVIDALSAIEDKTVIPSYQKYLSGKRKKYFSLIDGMYHRLKNK